MEDTEPFRLVEESYRLKLKLILVNLQPLL